MVDAAASTWPARSCAGQCAQAEHGDQVVRHAQELGDRGLRQADSLLSVPLQMVHQAQEPEPPAVDLEIARLRACALDLGREFAGTREIAVVRGRCHKEGRARGPDTEVADLGAQVHRWLGERPHVVPAALGQRDDGTPCLTCASMRGSSYLSAAWRALAGRR